MQNSTSFWNQAICSHWQTRGAVLTRRFIHWFWVYTKNLLWSGRKKY